MWRVCVCVCVCVCVWLVPVDTCLCLLITNYPYLRLALTFLLLGRMWGFHWTNYGCLLQFKLLSRATWLVLFVWLGRNLPEYSQLFSAVWGVAPVVCGDNISLGWADTTPRVLFLALHTSHLCFHTEYLAMPPSPFSLLLWFCIHKCQGLKRT